MLNTSKIPRLFTIESSFISQAKIPVFLISLYVSFFLLIIRTIALPLSSTFVPLIFVNQAIFFFSWKLGFKRAFISILLFLFQGNMMHLIQLGPLSGYQAGYLIAAIFIGLISNNMKEKTLLKAFLVFSLANVLMYFSGLVVLAPLLGLKKAFAIGVLPFLFPDFFKNILIVKLLKLTN